MLDQVCFLKVLSSSTVKLIDMRRSLNKHYGVSAPAACRTFDLRTLPNGPARTYKKSGGAVVRCEGNHFYLVMSPQDAYVGSTADNLMLETYTNLAFSPYARQNNRPIDCLYQSSWQVRPISINSSASALGPRSFPVYIYGILDRLTS